MRRSVRPLVPLNRELTRITGSRTTMPPPGITRNRHLPTGHRTAMRRSVRPLVPLNRELTRITGSRTTM
ncbi:hypothetical protein ACH4VS_34300, partial [Streptomyces hygroscopicus]